MKFSSSAVTLLLPALCLAYFLPSASLRGSPQQMDGEPPNVPPGMATADYSRFAPIKVSLDEKRQAALSDIATLNSQCGHVPSDDSAKIQVCQTWHNRIMDEIEGYNSQLRAYKVDLAHSIASALDTYDEKTAVTKGKVQATSASLKSYQLQLEQWVGLDVQAQQEAHEACMETLSSLLMARLALAREHDIVLTENVKQQIDLLINEKVLQNPYFTWSASFQSQLAEKLSKLHTERDALEALQSIKDGIGLFPEQDASNRHAVLGATLQVIALIDPDPRVDVLIDEGKLVSADVYLWKAQAVAAERVSQLLDLGALQLRALNSLTSLYEQQTKEREALRTELTKLGGRN